MKAIEALVEEYATITSSKRNGEKKRLWANTQAWYRDMWRGIPAAPSTKPPIVVAPENQFWSYMFDFSLVDYYSNPRTYLERQLQMYAYKHSHWDDDTFFDGNIYIWFSVVTELSLFGTHIIFREHQEPWLHGEPVLSQKEKLDTLEPPDFRKSGLMPIIHQYYEEISELVHGRLPVVFPSWVRGPFCIASHLRGVENILTDMVEDPVFIHRLMRFIVDCQKKWLMERRKFLGETELPRGKLFNDEIGEPSIGPKYYEEFILPYEIELAEFQNGIEYWHSCNNTTNFYRSIARIPGLEMIHVSPWSDNRQAVEVFGKGIAIDKCIHPNEDVLGVSKEKMKERMLNIITEYGSNARYAIRFDAIEKIHDIAYDVEKIDEFVQTYRGL